MTNPQILLLPLGTGVDEEARIRGGLLVARNLGAHLRVMYSRANAYALMPEDLKMPTGVMRDMERAMNGHCDSEAQRLQALFRQLCANAGFHVTRVIEDAPSTASWFEADGLRSQLIGPYGRLSDWIVLARPPLGQATVSFANAVLETGRPVLVIPRRLQRFDARRIMFAWNCSAEATRAMDAALPLMKRADHVVVVSSGDCNARKPGLQELADYLRMKGVQAEYHVLPVDSGQTGPALIATAERSDIALVVMGAVSQFNVRTRVVGGVTRFMLEKSTVPLLLSN